jgi:hypothetical protein
MEMLPSVASGESKPLTGRPACCGRRGLAGALGELMADFEVVRRGPGAAQTDAVDLEDGTVIYSLL